MRRVWSSLIALALVACATAPGVHARRSDVAAPAASTTEASAPSTTGTATGDPATTQGVGDSLFPSLGNPGIDVTHYAVTLAYDPATDLLHGTVGISLTLTDDRSSFTLDSAGPVIDTVTVGGATATFAQHSPKLAVTLPGPGHKGDHVQLQVTYHLAPKPRSATIGLNNGWFNTTGGSYVLNEPDAAHTWLPCNDHPSDKATYTFTITVPHGLTAVANGELTDHHAQGTDEVWVWNERRPMTTYLIELFTGDYQVVSGVGPHGLPLTSVVLRPDLAAMQPELDVTPKQIAFFEQYFGPYPLDRYGIAVTDSYSGLAMETQERSYFSRDDLLSGAGDTLLAHELTHQWFGDAVSPARWRDIWLNESFATYGEWMWAEHIGQTTVQDNANSALQRRQPGATADPTVGEMFGFNSYDGGAVVLHALRLTIGDDLFFTLLRNWVAQNNGTSRTTEDFVALAEKVAGRSLTQFFHDWLYSPETPTQFPR